MRYERKFRIEHASFNEVLQLIRLHPYGFHKTYNDRFVNTLYLDTPSLDFYKDTRAGVSQRFKPRIRWYGRNLRQALVPTLEVKTKKNAMGAKHLNVLPEFFVEDDFTFQEYVKQNLSTDFQNLVPAVLVRYERSYFESANQQIRLTLDRNLAYYPVTIDSALEQPPYHDQAVIMEIKYVSATENEINFLTQFFPFRMTKSSKYAQAVQTCYA